MVITYSVYNCVIWLSRIINTYSINRMVRKYQIFIMVHDIDLAKPVAESLQPLESEIFYAPNYPSFSKVVNN